MATFKSGTYAHRFQGNAVDVAGTPYFLAGVGTMDVTAANNGGTLTGRQESATLPIKGYGGALAHYVYDMAGSITPQTGRPMWDATITFTLVAGPAAMVMEGSFVLTPSGQPDCYWAVSTAVKIIQGGNAVPTEAVIGEIALIPG